MRYLYCLTFIFFINSFISAQTVPQEINYQAVVRDSSGAPLPEGQSITFNVRFFDESLTQIHASTVPTNIQRFGVVSFPIDASAISDKSIIYSIEVSTTEYGIIGNTVMKSVPYAFYAEGAKNAKIADSVTNLNIVKVEQLLIDVENGVFGQQGEPGVDGQSAYQQWIASGETGTVTEFLESLKGNTGADGQDGKDGTSVTIRGSVSDQTKLPTTATNGDGYLTEDNGHLWVWNGTVFIDAGLIQGPQGTTGAKGADGADGQSAYELWVASGETGTEAEFTDLLKGADSTEANNGLTMNGNTVELGGALTKSITTLTTNSNTLRIDSRNGFFRIQDSNQGNGKVLTSDGTGNATWQTLPAASAEADPVYEASLAANITTADTTRWGTVDDYSDLTNTPWTVNGVNIYRPTGNVGIGVTVPTNKLHITTGGIQLSNSEMANVTAAGGVFYYDANYFADAGLNYLIGDGGGLALYDNDKAAWGAILSTSNMEYLRMNLSGLAIGSSASYTGASAADANELIVEGNVGIGTDTPTSTLDINGDIRIRDASAQANYVLTASGAGGTATWKPIPAQGDITSISVTDGLGGSGLNSGTATVFAKAGNGLNVSPQANRDQIELGGALVTNTTLTAGAYNFDINLNGTGDFAVQSAGTDALFVRQDGYVGIGTTAPSTKLEVVSVTGETAITINRANSQASIEASPSNAGWMVVDGNHATNGNVGVNYFSTGDIIMAQGGGNVGIGTTAPSHKLTIAGTGAIIGIDNNSVIQAKNSTGAYENFLWPRFTNNGTYLNYGTGGFNIRSNNSTMTMHMTNTNKVGIGNIAPSTKLHVTAATGESAIMIDRAPSQASIEASTASSNWMIIDGNHTNNGKAGINYYSSGDVILAQGGGNVGIGTAAPNTELEVNGTTRITEPTNTTKYLEMSQTGDNTQINSSAGSDMKFQIGGTNRMIIQSSGNVVISDGNLEVSNGDIDVNDGRVRISKYLEVTGSFKDDHDAADNLRRYHRTGISEPYATDNVDIGIDAKYNVRAAGFIANSDRRIKKDIIISTSSEDLEILNNIEIVDYKMKDTINHGRHNFKKVIAQQVKEVYPLSVSSKFDDVVPDIYSLSKIKNNWVPLTDNISMNDTIKVIYEKGEKLFRVLEVGKNGFKIDLNYEGEVFVYGHLIHDMHAVDYEAISMLNVSATQEIYRHVQELEKENETLKQTNRINEQRIENLEASITSEKQDEQQIQELLQQLQERLMLLEASQSVGQKQ